MTAEADVGDASSKLIQSAAIAFPYVPNSPLLSVACLFENTTQQTTLMVQLCTMKSSV